MHTGMFSHQPAARWQDALPSGNGTVGALVYGHIRHELILLNHEALWFRSPRPALPDISAHLPALRRLLAEGQYREAEGFLDHKLQEAGYEYRRVDPYHPACDLLVDTDTAGAFTHYRRSLDFATGEVAVTWQEGESSFARRLFVSGADGVVVLRLEASGPGALRCRLRLQPHPGYPEQGPRTLQFETAVQGPWLSLVGRYQDGGEFGALALVTSPGGELAGDQEAVTVAGAREVVVLLGLFANEPADPALARLRGQLAALPPDYPALLARHVAGHGELFARLRLDLGGEDHRSNEELLLAAYDGQVPTALVERLFAYGRYLLISSSRPGGLPANLQGVWNGDYDPPWASDFHNDENIQMNYWQALPGNLPEVTLPYFDYYQASLPDYRTNAQRLFGSRGIYAPISQSTHGLAHPGPWVNWTAGAGWLAQLFYDYWLFTGDRDFLARQAVPFLREVALYYQDFLFAGEDGRLVFSPSLSPENVPAAPGASLVGVNATMDVAIAREVLANLCAACRELGGEAEEAARWEALRERLPAYQVNQDGALAEWLHPALPDNYHHRHQSHLYPLFPGWEITPEREPALFAAARIAVERRLVIGLNSQTGWSLAHMANIYARLGEGDRALECLELLARSCVGPNLFTYHNDWRSQGLTMFFGHERRPPFQIDANLGLAAAVLEMLAFSAPGVIKLLPALPSRWPAGRLEGLLCRGGVQLDLAWDLPKLQAALRSDHDQALLVHFPASLAALEADPPAALQGAPGPACAQVYLAAGKLVRLAGRLQP